MNIRTQLMKFLVHLERAIPPHDGGHHSITAKKYGSDEQGWEQRLSVNLCMAAGFQVIWLDNGDLECPADQLVGNIVKLVAPP